ncbi:MAG: DUF2255 family protein [Myxococcota bacterium]|jgi:hypothetical protein|nr:DUF2255 family protein [Myxococcota bacterium]
MYPWKIALIATFVIALAGIASAEYPDWNRLTNVQVIDVLTFDQDGALRETPVWFVLLNGEAYLRTSNSRWLENLRRDPKFRLKIEDKIYQARAEEISDQSMVEKVDIASQRKYGWQEYLINLFRMSPPEIIRILPRADP